MAGVIGAVIFDVGECLVNETREYGTWADRLSRVTCSRRSSARSSRGQDYRETFQVFQPGFDLGKARQQRADEGKPEWFRETTYIPMSGPRCPGSGMRACGSVSPGTRPPARARSCAASGRPPT